MMNRIRAALSCLRGYSTIYKVHFLQGDITIGVTPKGNIIDNAVHCGVKVNFSTGSKPPRFELEDYVFLEDCEKIEGNVAVK